MSDKAPPYELTPPSEPQVAGHRQLNQDEIDLINEIKLKEAELLDLVEKANSWTARQTEMYGTPDAEHYRWASIAKTHFEQGAMALVRAVACPIRVR
jgi:hypothetical protein